MENQANQSKGPSPGAPDTSPDSRKPQGAPDAAPETSESSEEDAYRHLLLAGEIFPRLKTVVDRCEAELATIGGVEDFLFTDLIVNHSRIWRYHAMETALVNHQLALTAAFSQNRFICGPYAEALHNTRGYNGMLHLLYRLEAMARRAYQSTLRTLLDYRARLLRYRRDVGVHDNDPPYPPTPVATKQNEPNQTETTTEQTTTKETPCNPQPDSQPID